MGNGQQFRLMAMRFRIFIYCLVLLVFAGLSVPATTVVFNQTSDPLGIISQSVTVSTPSNVLTVAAPLESSGYRFTHWTINGARLNEFNRRALNPALCTVLEPTEAVAHYLPSTNDIDSDLVPDWYEIHFNGDTNQTAGSDSDGDGINLLKEYALDYHPGLSNSVTVGGVSQRNSDQALIIMNPAFHVYEERSSPAGFVSRRLVLSNGNSVVSQNLSGENSGYTFAYWKVNGVRQQDSFEIALSRFTVVVTGTTTAVAYYYNTTNDLDGNGIPDWYEWKYVGAVSNAPSSDMDGDGLTLAQEYQLDYSPALSNMVVAGGIAQRNSDLVSVNLGGFSHYFIQSEPLGLITTVDEYAPTGTVVTTQSLHGDASGYSFGYWAVNGARQADKWGVALSRSTFSVTGAMEVVAHYLVTTNDTDGDGIRDWYEWQNYGSLSYGASSDTEGDGITLLQEYNLDYQPVFTNSVIPGGVAQRNSELVSINLQPFERVEYALANGVLTNLFTVWPTGVTGFYFGRNSVPAVGDWDGDGDLDIFVGSSGEVMRVYENIGTKTTLNIVDRSSAFIDLANRWSDIRIPYPALGDWDNNGRADLAIGCDTGVIRLISSTANFVGSHSPSVDYAIDTGSTSAIPAFADVVDSTNLDLLVMLGDGTVRTYGNTGNPSHPYDSGSYIDNVLGVSVPYTTGISGKDIDGNGYDDVLVSDVYGRIWEFYQNTNRTFTLVSRVWGGSGKGFANGLTLALGDLDGDSDTDALCGFSLGGLMYLRDPRIGIPSGLKAYGGADSILLTWDPNTHYRFRGYYSYRGVSSSGDFSRVSNILRLSNYADTNVTGGLTYFYNVKTVSAAMCPGNTIEKLIESNPSETVSATLGSIVLWMSDYNASAGTVATLKVNANNATGIAGHGMDIRITYDPNVIKPVSQVISSNASVELTILTQGLTVTNNATTANGELRITGSGGVVAGEGHLFDIKFFVLNGVTPGTMRTNVFSLAHLENQAGSPLAVDYSSKAVLTVVGVFIRGDVDGNGVVDHDDCKALEQIVAHRLTPAPDQLKAGDMDGNGYLDHNDFKLLHDYHRGKPTNPGK